MTSELKRYSTCNYSEFDYSSRGEWVKFTDAEAALAVRDKRIKELEALVEKIKCCWNCKHFDACDSVDEGCESWEPRT